MPTFRIRSFLKSAIDPKLVKHAYIPDVYGRERRKRRPSKEGKLGVEGMSAEVLIEALRRAGAEMDGEALRPRNAITKADMYILGLTGKPESARRRAAVKKALDLPENLTVNALTDVLNVLVEREELIQILEKVT